jgi:hypothetical protein
MLRLLLCTGKSSTINAVLEQQNRAAWHDAHNGTTRGCGSSDQVEVIVVTMGCVMQAFLQAFSLCAAVCLLHALELAVST